MFVHGRHIRTSKYVNLHNYIMLSQRKHDSCGFDFDSRKFGGMWGWNVLALGKKIHIKF